MSIADVLPFSALVLFAVVILGMSAQLLSARHAGAGLFVVLVALLGADLAQWSQDPGPAWASWTVDGDSIQLVRTELFARVPVFALAPDLAPISLLAIFLAIPAIAAHVLTRDDVNADTANFASTVAPPCGLRPLRLRSGASDRPHGPPPLASASAG